MTMLVLGGAIYIVLRETDAREKLLEERQADEVTPGDLVQSALKRRESERTAAVARLASVQTELRDLGEHAWAGTYGFDDRNGTGVRIAIAPKGGFTYLFSSKSESDANHGDIIRVAEGRMLVQLALDPSFNLHERYLRQSLASVADEYFFVNWGPRRYLIAKPWMQAFCNAVNDGSERREPRFPHDLARGAGDPGELSPDVPLAYRDWLLMKPVEGSVLAVGDVDAKDADGPNDLKLPLDVTVNVGRLQGLAPGMVMWLVEKGGYAEGEVMSADDHSAQVEFRFAIGSTVEPERIRPGWKVSTLRPYTPPPPLPKVGAKTKAE